MEDRDGSPAQQVGAVLELVAQFAQVGRFAVADRDHKVRSGEDMHLAELDGLGLVDVPGRAQHAEQRGAVPLELRALMGVHRVLDGERVQVELARDLVELLVGRAVEADPGDRVLITTDRGHVGELLRLGDALTVAVDGTTDYHAREPTGESGDSLVHRYMEGAVRSGRRAAREIG